MPVIGTTATEQEEYRALRQTIRERGSLRVWIFVAGISIWGALVIATAALLSAPIAILVPLLVLAATFEAVYALHVGVERVGRYLAVFYDDSWEAAAAGFGRPSGAAAIDPLFGLVFAIAALINLSPMLVAQPAASEWIFVGGAHALFGVRLVFAKLTAAKQREIDRARFQDLRSVATSRRSVE